MIKKTHICGPVDSTMTVGTGTKVPVQSERLRPFDISIGVESKPRINISQTSTGHASRKSSRARPPDLLTSNMYKAGDDEASQHGETVAPTTDSE
jgi:hypothetical protein